MAPDPDKLLVFLQLFGPKSAEYTIGLRCYNAPGQLDDRYPIYRGTDSAWPLLDDVSAAASDCDV